VFRLILMSNNRNVHRALDLVAVGLLIIQVSLDGIVAVAVLTMVVAVV